MIEMGIVVAIGLIVMFCKLSWRARLRMLSHPLILDIGTFVLISFLHWGTFSGMMVAAVGALCCSLCISAGRKLFGYYERGEYVPGRFNMGDRL